MRSLLIILVSKNQAINTIFTHSAHSTEETEFNWLYVARNSVPKYTANDVERNDKHRNHRSNTESMGIENVDGKKWLANSGYEILLYYDCFHSLLIHHPKVL